LVMDPTPSNGSGMRARSRKANTSPAQAPNQANGKVKRSTAAPGRQARQAGVQAAPEPRPAASLPPFESYPAIAIEDVQPELDGGQWPIKRVVGDTIVVTADIFKEGHDLLQARVVYHAL